MKNFKAFLNYTLGLFGYCVIKKNNQLINWDLKTVLKEPDTVIDIGIGDGTPDLYKSFPNSNLILVDPLVECEPVMKNILRNRKGRYYICALGAEQSERTIKIYDDLSCSSLNERYYEKSKLKSERLVSIKPLDAIVWESKLKSPFLIKIDTEGHELEVVKGAQNTLKNTNAIIAELSVSNNRFKDSYRFAEFVEFVNKYELHLTKILSIKPDKKGGIERMDCLFCKENARLYN